MDEMLSSAWNGTQQLRLLSIRRRVYKKAVPLTVELFATPQPVPYSQRAEAEGRLIRRGSSWGGLFDSAWLHITCKIPQGFNKDNSLIWLNTHSEGALFNEEGSPIQGLSIVAGYLDAYSIKLAKQTLDIPQHCFDKGEIDLWVETANNGLLGRSYGKSRLVANYLVQVDRELKAFYYDYLMLYFILRESDSKRSPAIRHALSAAFFNYKQDVKKAREYLAVELNKTSQQDFTVIALGHSHLDMAWLWPVRETKRKAGRTFSNALHNIEKYPDYIFGASQAQQFAWVQENYPELFQRIKAAVAKGQIELLGSMWVEPDINMSDGESLIRQIYYGKRYFIQNFGHAPNVCWLPDVFGFSGSLPQILQGCGVDYFMTIKLSWNKFHKPPYTTFNWAGIDGSQVLVHMPPEGVYCSDMVPYTINKAMKRNKDDASVVKQLLMPFGPGDGGGGAGEVHLECLARERSLEDFPKVRTGTSQQFFDDLSPLRPQLPTHNGELYLEAHQGTYTSQVEQKVHNRLCQRLMHKLEYLEAVTGSYDEKADEECWKEVLLQQFHDILPGTSIALVHEESLADYAKIEQKLYQRIEGLLNKLGDESGLSAINYAPVPQKRWIKHNNKWYLAGLDAYGACPVTEAVPDASSLTFGDNFIGNGLLRATFDEAGVISSLVDAEGKEYSKGGLNRLTVYVDKRLWWNASDMDWKYPKKFIAQLKLLSHKTYIDGDSVIREQRFKFYSTTLVQKVKLSLDIPYVEFETEMDFKERLKMLRADFFPAEFGDKAVCDIQFGNISRSTKKQDFAQFEVSAHKWVDVSNEKFGSAVLCDSRYGYRAKDGLLSLCLVRGTVFPGKKGGVGKHAVRYAYYPHRGGAFDSELTRLGYAFSYPPEIIKGTISVAPPISVEQANVIVETVKPSLGGIICRIYEAEGKETTVDIILKDNYSIAICDMLENVLTENASRQLHFKPYEVKTLLLSPQLA